MVMKKEAISMNKTELAAALAAKCSMTKKDAEAAIGALTSIIEETLKTGEKVQIVGFGTFEVKERAERPGRNPQTGESITIAAGKAPVFKAGKALKDAVDA
jgi:DNA-binding protein HU-beta